MAGSPLRKSHSNGIIRSAYSLIYFLVLRPVLGGVRLLLQLLRPEPGGILVVVGIIIIIIIIIIRRRKKKEKKKACYRGGYCYILVNGRMSS